MSYSQPFTSAISLAETTCRPDGSQASPQSDSTRNNVPNLLWQNGWALNRCCDDQDVYAAIYRGAPDLVYAETELPATMTPFFCTLGNPLEGMLLQHLGASGTAWVASQRIWYCSSPSEDVDVYLLDQTHRGRKSLEALRSGRTMLPVSWMHEGQITKNLRVGRMFTARNTIKLRLCPDTPSLFLTSSILIGASASLTLKAWFPVTWPGVSILLPTPLIQKVSSNTGGHWWKEHETILKKIKTQISADPVAIDLFERFSMVKRDIAQDSTVAFGKHFQCNVPGDESATRLVQNTERALGQPGATYAIVLRMMQKTKDQHIFRMNTLCRSSITHARGFTTWCAVFITTNTTLEWVCWVSIQ